MPIDIVGDKVEEFLTDKRNELIWALFKQDYTPSQIGKIFNMKHISTVMRIIGRCPPRWVPKWVKKVYTK